MIDKKTFYNWNAAYISNKYISAIKSQVKRAFKTMINGEKGRNAWNTAYSQAKCRTQFATY